MFEFNRKDRGLAITITAKRFDATNSDRFKALLEEHCTEPLEFAEVHVEAVEFIDSSGVGALLSIHKCLDDSDKSVSLVNPQPATLSIIDVLRLGRLFRSEVRQSSV